MSEVFPHLRSFPTSFKLGVRDSPSSSPGIRVWIFCFQTGSRGTGGGGGGGNFVCNTQMYSGNATKINKHKPLWWWAKPLKTKYICENKQIASFRQSGSRAILGAHLWGVLISQNGRRMFVYSSPNRRSKQKKKHVKHQANVGHFDTSRKRIPQRMHERECLNHWVYNLWSWPLMRDRPARVLGQIATDHCRSGLITGRPPWAPAGTLFRKLIYLSRRFTP